MYTIEQTATLIGAHRIGTQNTTVAWLLTDSRSLSFPETTMFFAICTQKNDGHRYVADLYARGVRSFVVAHEPEVCQADANYLVVTSPQKALQRLAERHREEFDIPVVGITGSNGKTIVKEWLYQLLSPDYNVTRSPRSWNSQIGVPLSVWRLDEKSEIGIFETGISESGEMEPLEAIIQPTIGVLTCIGSAHDENFGTRKEKCVEKLRLFKNAEVLVYMDADDSIQDPSEAEANRRLVRECIAESKFGGRLVAVRPARQFAPFKGEGLDEDVALCRAVCLLLGMDENVVEERIQHLEPVAMRLEVIEGQHNCTLISDSFNNDLVSLEIALDTMRRRPESSRRRRLLVLSDIKQTGLTIRELYARVRQLVEEYGVDDFVGIGPEISSGLSQPGEQRVEPVLFETTSDFLNSAYFGKIHDSIVLIKGARQFNFSEITDALRRQEHETTLEVNLSALVDNLNYYRSMMQPQTKIICMVKASAYGAGDVEVAKTLQDHCVDYLAVAVADEGVTLRKAGITTGIIVMNPEMSALRTLFEYNLEPEVYSFRLLDAMVKVAEHEGIVAFPVHIKLDTGMHRLGFDPDKDMPALVERLHQQQALIPRSVFSHFVGSDSDDFDTFSQIQFERFMRGGDALQSAFPHRILRHICNSAGIEHFPERHLDMVRLGLGLYGINARNNAMLHCLSTLKTTILQIHEVEATETVGYSRRGKLSRTSRIAALPIGYADGLNRHLGCGKAYCLVNGQKAYYVGNICMDVCMIDVTDIPCKEGDTAVIFGTELPPTVLAEAIDTIPYEILTAVSPRVKRIYYFE